MKHQKYNERWSNHQRDRDHNVRRGPVGRDRDIRIDRISEGKR